jgi:acyl carrier protein
VETDRSEDKQVGKASGPKTSGNGAPSEDDAENFAKFQKCAADVLNVPTDKVKPDTTFEQLDADSLDVVELLMALEETFGIEIEENELDGIETVEQAFSLVTSKL